MVSSRWIDGRVCCRRWWRLLGSSARTCTSSRSTSRRRLQMESRASIGRAFGSALLHDDQAQQLAALLECRQVLCQQVLLRLWDHEEAHQRGLSPPQC
jgi:hypothetical protein